MSGQTTNKVREILATVFSVDAGAITDTTSPDNLENWDSLQHMNMIASLEEEFGISFNDDQISDMLDFKSVVSVVEQLKK
jgi:acyl carrier protein